jgi:hypothetical protein
LVLQHDTVTNNGDGGFGGAAGTRGDGSGDPLAASPGEDRSSSVGVSELEAVGLVVGTSSGAGDDCWFLPLTAVDSYSTDESCDFGAGSVKTFASFAFSPLDDHGGPTETRLPLPGSVLVNVIAPAACSVDDDQRAITRPIETGCEVGSVEVAAPVTLAVTKAASKASVELGKAVGFTITVTNTGAGTPLPGVALVDAKCSTPALTGGDANSNGTLDPAETWTYTCSATPAAVGTYVNVVTAKVTAEAGDVTGTAQASVEVTAVQANDLSRGLPITGTNTRGLLQLALSLIGMGLLMTGAATKWKAVQPHHLAPRRYTGRHGS